MIFLFLALVGVVAWLKIVRWTATKPAPRSFRTAEIQSGHVVLRCGCVFAHGTQPRPCKAHELLANLV